MINNPIQTRSAHLIWQSPLGGDGSRRRMAVALLSSDPKTGSVSFKYLFKTPDFEAAREEGFIGYTGIPLDREDTSDAISTLGRRLPNPDRPDYPEYLAKFGLSPDHNLPTLSLLAYTGAKLTSDSFSVADTFEGFDRPFQYIFDVAGRRHHVGSTPEPKIGDAVVFSAEGDNIYDRNAVALLDDSGRKYGYVNACQSAQVRSWLTTGSVSGRVFRVNGRPSYPRLFVLADVVPKISAQAA